ncbi:MAG: hypothetical protein Q4G47_00790, partial [Lachnospiraceae bacterium]|nr:hypothetical protein [Lachnospiraceae bacterium]
EIPEDYQPDDPEQTEQSGETATQGPDYYILNRNTKVFHIPTCSDVKKMKEYNKIISRRSPDEIIADGYRRCEHCLV